VTRWFTTLRGQFVLVTAAAVILSNLAVAVLIETVHESEMSGARNAALVARVGAVADLVSSLPREQSEQALRAVNSRFVHYWIATVPPHYATVMTEEERGIAGLVQATEHAAVPREVHVRLYQDTGDGPHGMRHPRAVTEIAQPLTPHRWLMTRYERPLPPPGPPDILLAAAAGTILTCAAAAWIAGRVSRPLSALAAAADAVARGRNAPRLEARGPDDLKRAAEAFNAMSDRVQRTLDSHRQLLSAVGHDLRTPISAMRITAEFVGDAEVRDRLTRNLEELQSLTEAVLDAARASPGEATRRVDLAALIESLCADLVDLGDPVEVAIEGSAPCLCRPNEIRRALRNLIENAVRYGGRARVSLETQDDSYLAIVDDDGPGIPPERLERVFEPFVRLEASRSNTTGGAGLGLTLARTIAREHGGDVTLENRAGGGLRAKLSLPREKLS
jgi:signal transduction histidine kinase